MDQYESDITLQLSILLSEKCNKSNEKISYSTKGPLLVVDVEKTNSWNLKHKFKSLIQDVFLPKGYPESVSSDYLEYQIWDTCQAFCSSISGTLSMRAVLQGIGVGSEASTPASAAVTWLLKDGTGMIGSILFAWLKGSKLDSDCKKWRLFADILNDIAMFLELFIPYFMEYSMYMLCIATVFKALVGTAGSSTRAALITHQAIKGNIADVSAKDGSQEIFINLCAFIFGIFILKNVNESEQIWTVMCTATLFHLLFNYKAVRCLKINVFNNERFRICLRTYLPTSIVASVGQINEREPVFLMQGTSDIEVFGFSIVFGACLKKVMRAPGITASVASFIMAMFQSKKYVIMPDLKNRKLYVGFLEQFEESDVLRAYFHASFLAISLNYLQGRKNLTVLARCRKNSPMFRFKNILQEFLNLETDTVEDETSQITMQAYTVCQDFIEKEFTAFCAACDEANWETSKHLINIGDWRAEWKYVEKKKLAFDSPSPQGRSSISRQKQHRPSQQDNRRKQVVLIT